MNDWINVSNRSCRSEWGPHATRIFIYFLAMPRLYKNIERELQPRVNMLCTPIRAKISFSQNDKQGGTFAPSGAHNPPPPVIRSLITLEKMHENIAFVYSFPNIHHSEIEENAEY
jgi:hypothetical protein